MNQLRLAGIHDDGQHLVLESADGGQFVLAIDQNLRTSIAKARRIQPVRGLASGGAFGPRDIQTRFRQGASVEEIVAESGWEADRVRRYEWPIVAERANIISMARKVLISQPVTGRRSDSSAHSLDEYIEQVGQQYGFDPAEADWNTYQQESGQWSVTVDFGFSSETHDSFPRGVLFPARWSYNPANQSIYASNEAAYFLMGRDHSGDAPLPGIGSHTPEPQQLEQQDSQETSAVSTNTLKAVSSAESGHDELLDELENRRGIRDFSSARERKLADLLARARRTPHSPMVRTEDGAAAETAQNNTPHGGTVSEIGSDRKAAEAPVAEKGQGASQSQPEKEEKFSEHSAFAEGESTVSQENSAELSQDVNRQKNEASAAEAETAATATELKADSEESALVASAEDSAGQKTAPKPASRSKRASVPSWDDIIFGHQRK